ncbi:MAG: tetratricopeptide repeat protein [Bacteroidota bacterium]|jgi:Flp pilus assembly protein TadD|nr:tetratricopeptide repeat protein [Bacteroidota bacterium]
MRKITLSLILIFSVFFAFAQNSNVNKAVSFEQKGDLAKAKEAIDQAVNHDKTKNKGKTWFTKGTIYEAIASSEEYNNLHEDPLQEAVEAFQKAKELEKENSTYHVFATERIEALWGTYLNHGAEAYQNEDYAKAYEEFTKAASIKPEDTTAYLYGGIAAQQNNQYDEALKSFYKLTELGYDEIDIYNTIIYLERTHNEDNDKALEVVRTAREKHPDNKELLKEEINILITTEKVDEARAKLEEAVQAEPDNPSLYYNLGYLHDATKNKDEAIRNYEKAIEIDPNHFESNFNIAVNHYNNAAEILKKANDMDLKTYQKDGKKLEEQAKENFEKALPYLEKSRTLQPEDPTVLSTLQTVYTQLKMDEKAEEIAQQLEKIEGEESN